MIWIQLIEYTKLYTVLHARIIALLVFDNDKLVLIIYLN